MPSNDPTALLVLGEISGILFIVVMLLLSGMLLRNRKHSKLLSTMLKRVSENESKRRETLRGSLSGMDGKSAESLVDEIVAQETVFYRLIASAFIGNNISNIQHLDEEVQKLVAPYGKLFSQKLESGKAGDARGNESDDPGFDDAIDDLLANEEPAVETNPEFDLSETEGIGDDASSGGLGIAEIPEDLLGDAAEAK